MATTILRPVSDTLIQWDYPSLSTHYTETDETSHDSDTTYIGDNGYYLPNSTGAIDVAGLTSWTLGAQYIEKVEVTYYGRKSIGVGFGSITCGLRLSGTYVWNSGGSDTMTTSYAKYGPYEISRPGGGHWDYTDMSSLKVALTCGGGSARSPNTYLRVTQVYVTVTYSPYFHTIDATGYCDPPYKSTFYLTDDDSDLADTPSPYSDSYWDMTLAEETGTTFVVLTGTGNDTETFYWFTKENVPYNDDWEDGAVLAIFDVLQPNSEVHVRFRVTRVNSSGVVQESTTWSDWQEGVSYGELSLLIEGVTWTSGSRSDRMRFDLEVYSDWPVGQDFVIGMSSPYDPSYLRTCVLVSKFHNIDATGHILEQRTYDESATGHVLEQRSHPIDSTGHVKDTDRTHDIDATGHIKDTDRTHDEDATGHVKDADRSYDEDATGHVKNTNRTYDEDATGHVKDTDRSYNESVTGHVKNIDRTHDEDATGHVKDTDRSYDESATGHILEIRSATIDATGHVASDVSPSPSPFPSPEERDYDKSATGHVKDTGRTYDENATGHIKDVDRTYDESATGHVKDPDRTSTIDATGHILQERSLVTDATGHIKDRNRKFDISATGFVEGQRQYHIDATGYVKRKGKYIPILDISIISEAFKHVLVMRDEKLKKQLHMERENERKRNSPSEDSNTAD